MEVTDTTFQEKVLDRSKELPVVVDFWAPWCMPCQVLGPTLERLSKEYKGKVDIVKINVDDNPKTSEQYDISSIPAVKMIKNGDVVDEFVGALPEKAIKDWIEGATK